MLDRVTVLILTLDEEANIGRALERLRWARRVVLLDSGSSDATLAIAGRYPNIEVFHRRFDSHTDQWNHGLHLCETEWVLAMDADYVPGPGLEEEIPEVLSDAEGIAGFEARFRYCIDGRPLRASLYPPRVVLFRRAAGRYVADGHTQRLTLNGPVRSLRTVFDHDDRKSRARWLANQRQYADLEAEKLLSTPAAALSGADRVRRLGWLAPLVMPAYCLLVKGLVLDGRAGLAYTAQRTYAEWLLARRVWGRRGRCSVSS
jgi:glycosyltransferase involved in cell wall biosynthesis